MVVLKKVNAISAAKIGGLVYLLVGLVEAVFILFFSVVLHGIFGSGLNHPVLGLSSVIITPIIAVVIGFFVVGIVAWMYNFVSKKWGGVKLDLKGSELRRIDPMSLGKAAAIIAVVVGLVLGVVFGVVAGAAAWATGAGGFGALLALGIIIVYPIVSAVAVFILQVIFALLYNFVASRIGGVDLYFKGTELKSIGTLSYAKIQAVFGVIGGLIYGLAVAAIFSLVGSVPGFSSGMMSGVIGSLGPLAIIVFPIVFGIIAFFAAGFEALVYNWSADTIGGVKVVLSKK